MISTTSIEHKDYPVRENTIRMSASDFTILEQKGDDLMVTKINTFDLGCYYPPRLLNMVVAQNSKLRTLTHI